jgi:hypothetical protein
VKAKALLLASILSISVVVFSLGQNQASAWIFGDIIACDPVIESLEVASTQATGSQGTNIPENVFDGLTSTRWSDDNSPSQLQVKLDKPKVLCSVDIAFYRGDERTTEFTAQVSKDGVTWIDTFTGRSVRTEDFQHFVFNKKQHDMQYLKLEFKPSIYADNSTTAWTSITELMIDRPNPDRYLNLNVDPIIDKFGIEKLYPTKDGQEWYVNMADPRSDPSFRNLPSMTKQADGSWQVSASQVRMEAWSPPDEKWLNVEITGYAKMVSGTNELLQWYSRGGHHTSNDPCLGSAVKARLYGDGEARWVKEITHPAYTGNRGAVQATTEPLADRWIGFKAVIYNFEENGNTYVRMESYVDDDVTDSNGNLVIKNDWKLASVVEDRGGWGTTNPDFEPDCRPADLDSNDQYRQRDDILSMSGGTSTQNIAAWRSDDLTWNWKYLSVREISS